MRKEPVVHWAEHFGLAILGAGGSITRQPFVFLLSRTPPHFPSATDSAQSAFVQERVRRGDSAVKF